jgi:hypothetical protein
LVDAIPLNVAHLLTPYVNLGYSGTLLPPQSKGLSGFPKVLCCTWLSEPADKPDGASGIFTPAKASLPLPVIKPGPPKPTRYHYSIQAPYISAFGISILSTLPMPEQPLDVNRVSVDEHMLKVGVPGVIQRHDALEAKVGS